MPGTCAHAPPLSTRLRDATLPYRPAHPSLRSSGGDICRQSACILPSRCGHWAIWLRVFCLQCFDPEHASQRRARFWRRSLRHGAGRRRWHSGGHPATLMYCDGPAIARTCRPSAICQTRSSRLGHICRAGRNLRSALWQAAFGWPAEHAWGRTGSSPNRASFSSDKSPISFPVFH